MKTRSKAKSSMRSGVRMFTWDESCEASNHWKGSFSRAGRKRQTTCTLQSCLLPPLPLPLREARPLEAALSPSGVRGGTVGAAMVMVAAGPARRSRAPVSCRQVYGWIGRQSSSADGSIDRRHTPHTPHPRQITAFIQWAWAKRRLARSAPFEGPGRPMDPQFWIQSIHIPTLGSVSRGRADRGVASLWLVGSTARRRSSRLLLAHAPSNGQSCANPRRASGSRHSTAMDDARARCADVRRP